MSIIGTIASEAKKATGIRIVSAGDILWIIMEVAIAKNRKKAPTRLQHKIIIIFSALFVFSFGVLSCVLKIIVSPPFRLYYITHLLINQGVALDKIGSKVYAGGFNCAFRLGGILPYEEMTAKSNTKRNAYRRAIPSGNTYSTSIEDRVLSSNLGLRPTTKRYFCCFHV